MVGQSLLQVPASHFFGLIYVETPTGIGVFNAPFAHGERLWIWRARLKTAYGPTWLIRTRRRGIAITNLPRHHSCASGGIGVGGHQIRFIHY